MRASGFGVGVRSNAFALVARFAAFASAPGFSPRFTQTGSRFTGTALGLVALAVTPAVLAAPDAKPPAGRAIQEQARTEMKAGVSAAEAGEHESALGHFKKAIELVPEANLPHRYAARSLEALARWDEAIAEHEEYLRVKPDVSDAGTVRDRIEEIRRTRLFGFVKLACQPAASQVRVDGKDVVLPESGELRLPRGTHRLQIRAPGHDPLTLDVAVGSGMTTTPECNLAPTTTPVLPPPSHSAPSLATHPTPESPHDRPTPWYGRWYTWTAASVVVVGAVVTAFVIGSQTSPPPSTEGGNHAFP